MQKRRGEKLRGRVLHKGEDTVTLVYFLLAPHHRAEHFAWGGRGWDLRPRCTVSTGPGLLVRVA